MNTLNPEISGGNHITLRDTIKGHYLKKRG